jgi:hypothetical protein
MDGWHLTYFAGSLPLANTIGLVLVADLAASADTTLPVQKIKDT